MSPKLTPKITDTEWEIMRVVWAQHPVTASEIVRQLSAEDPSWHPKTVRTLLARLTRRGALRFERRGRAYVYEPRVTEHECVAAASESFVERILGGSLKPMLAHFVEARRLTRKDLEELGNLLDDETRNQSLQKGKPSWKR
jgi:BlaI family transcriptional regulator, penicillinase repressor